MFYYELKMLMTAHNAVVATVHEVERGLVNVFLSAPGNQQMSLQPT